MATSPTERTLASDPTFLRSASELYGAGASAAPRRYAELCSGLTGDVRFFSSPGRAELVGNHTDHNGGLVLAGAIEADIACAAVATDSPIARVESAGFPPFELDLSDLGARESERGTSKALLRGVCRGLVDRGYAVGGFDARMSSAIFPGAGVSSSAALELLFCEALSVMRNGGSIDPTTKALIGRFAENEYFGKPSGLMDQLTIARGGISLMDFGPDIPVASSVPNAFGDLSLFVIDCGGDHSRLTAAYAAVRSEMREIAGFFGRERLGEVAESAFRAALPALKTRYPGRSVLRAAHFFDENRRVKDAFRAMSANDEPAFLKALAESGASSMACLQNCCMPGDVAQRIPLALYLCSRNASALACRVHGGGFEGTILALARDSDAARFADGMSKFFGAKSVLRTKIRQKGAAELKWEASSAHA